MIFVSMLAFEASDNVFVIFEKLLVIMLVQKYKHFLLCQISYTEYLIVKSLTVEKTNFLNSLYLEIISQDVKLGT